MARKRMISPEFWTDGTMVRLPFEARLTYIGLWNFADDYGFLEDDPERLRLQVLPSDDVDFEALLDLLIAAGRLDRYEGPGGCWFLHIRKFSEHQRVDHPSKPTFPPREDSRKLAIPSAVRREVAEKYGCPPGGECAARCYYCGAAGTVRWWRTSRGVPGQWVSFSGLEIDHFLSEEAGGPTRSGNLVLACRYCNRQKKTASGVEFLSREFASSPVSFSPNRKEEKRREENHSPTESVAPAAPDAPLPPSEKPAERPPRKRDVVFEAIQAVWPAGPRTDVERGKWNKAAKELRDGGVTPEQILTAARHWPNVMGAATMTPMALAANLGLLLDGPQVDGRSTGTTLAPKPAAPVRNDNPEAALPAWTPEQAAASDAARERTKELMKRAARIGGGA